MAKPEARRAIRMTKKIAADIKAGDVLEDRGIARVSIVGVGMKSHPGVAAAMFGVMAENKINIEMISTSEISISCVVKKSSGKKALKALHRAFDLGLCRK